MKCLHRNGLAGLRALAGAAALMIAGGPAGGAGAAIAGGTTRPMSESAVRADPVASAARELVTSAAVGVIVPGPGTSKMGAVRPVTCVRLPGGELLTAAHTLPREQLGAGEPYRDPATGAIRVDRAGEAEDLVLIVDELICRARVTQSEVLRYATALEGSRAAAGADWAVITPDEETAWETPVVRIGEAVPGERCYMVGYPASLMDPDLFELDRPVGRVSDLRWVGVPAVVIEGVVGHAGRDRVVIETEGRLGAKGRGLSGGGVFVDRGGEPVLVGIAVQASRKGGEVTACPLPAPVIERFEPRGTRLTSSPTRTP